MAVTVENVSRSQESGKVPPQVMRYSPDSLSVSNAEASLQFTVSDSGINVNLLNNAPVFALRFELAFGGKFAYRAPDLSDRVQGLNNYVNFQDNTLTFVLLDMDGKGIQPGDGNIIRIPFEPGQEFEITSSYASFGTFGIVEIQHSISNDKSKERVITLEQNEPNPFNGSTRIEYSIPERTSVRLVVYDVAGALIRTLLDSTVGAGRHVVEWDGKDDSGRMVEAGIYLYKLYAGINSVTQKMVFLG